MLMTGWDLFKNVEIQWFSHNFQDLCDAETWGGCRIYIYSWKKVNGKGTFLHNCKRQEKSVIILEPEEKKIYIYILKYVSANDALQPFGEVV